MPNPVSAILRGAEPFVYHHTHEVTPEVLAAAVDAGKSLEIDIAVDAGGEPYVGHSAIFYESRRLPMPRNVPLDDVVAALEDVDVLAVLDCKDARALPCVREIVDTLGPDRTLFHSWVDALRFEPYAPSILREPQWPVEDLPLGEVLELADRTGVPLALSCRGLTADRLEAERDRVLAAVTPLAAHGDVAIGFTLPGLAAPPPSLVDELLTRRLLTMVHVDLVPAAATPERYLGVTDDLVKASDFPAEVDDSEAAA